MVRGHLAPHSVVSSRIVTPRFTRGLVAVPPSDQDSPPVTAHVSAPVVQFSVPVSAPVSRILPRVVRGIAPGPIQTHVASLHHRLNYVVEQAPPQPTYNPETTVWGPVLWKVLHTLAEFNTDSELWNNLITRLTIDIPCVICRTHFTTYVQTQPITSFDTVSLVNWFFNLHNSVNQRTDKPVVTTIPSYESFRASLTSLIQELSVSFPPETLQLLLQLGQNPP
jgi:hypothetical protein